MTTMLPDRENLLKGRVLPQKIFLKYVILRTVTKISTIIITKYTWYHKYREIIKITVGPPLRFTGSQIWRREGENSNAVMSHEHYLDWRGLWFLMSVDFWVILNHLPLIRFLLTQIDTVVCHLWHNFNMITAIYSGIILCSCLFTCFCTGSTDFRSTGYAEVKSAFRTFLSLSSFKMAVSINMINYTVLWCMVSCEP